MTYSPLYVGQTHGPLQATLKDDAGNAVDLTGATLSVVFKEARGRRFTGTGDFAITDAIAGTFTYELSEDDVAKAGSYEVQFKATYSDGAQLADVILLLIKPAI